MATVVKTPSATWKAMIRRSGWPPVIKTFRVKRDAEDWARRTEDEIVRGAYIERATADRMTIKDALARYLTEVTPTKRQKPRYVNAASPNRFWNISANTLLQRLHRLSSQTIVTFDLLVNTVETKMATLSL